jgi:beta-glucosidase
MATAGFRDVDRLVAAMTLDEKASLTAGSDLWNTTAVERLGVPAITVADGPNGARGTALFGLGTETSVCIPCGSALGATWDPALVERVGAMVGEDAHTKACRVLLAPTVNIHRSPIAGRNFECYSEDPLLSGRTAAAFVRGVQSQGIVTTVKHFAGNDAEFERNTINSVIDARALREIYLVPFELAVREGGALGVMTAYNRLNGTHCAEHEELVTRILRGEWGFEGLVLTDWFSAGSTLGSAGAGVDLEMPGPGRFFGAALADAVRNGELAEAVVDEQARRLLRVFDRIGALDDPPARVATSVDKPEHRALAREAATGATVLLQNDGVLPFAVESLRTLAVVGPNAERPQMMGGGSAALAPHYRISPLDALRTKLAGRVDVRYERGCDIEKTTAPLGGHRVTTPDGEPGLLVDLFAGVEFAGEPVQRSTFSDGKLMFAGPPNPRLAEDDFSFRAHARFTPDESGVHTFTLVQAGGGARLLVDGAVALDGVTDPPGPGTEFFGIGSAELRAEVELTAGTAVDLEIEFAAGPGIFFRGVKVGCRLPAPPDLLDRAVATAAAADAAVVIVGTNDDWESEGEDRATMDLPGAQDDLVARVVAANPNCAVVVNTGSPVTMDWADQAPALLQVWFGGQEMANAIADVLFGDAEPAGRLPTTLPVRLEHNPAYGNFPGENSEIRYGESVFVGYRWYDARHLPTRFPFGHGLSYTTFSIGAPVLSSNEFVAGATLKVAVPVQNTGSRRGAAVVQCYVAPRASRLVRPPQELKAFAKVGLDAGARTTVELELGDRAFSYWDPGDPFWAATAEQRAAGVVPAGGGGSHRTEPGWYADPGVYDIRIGRSCAAIDHVATVEIRDARPREVDA